MPIKKAVKKVAKKVKKAPKKTYTVSRLGYSDIIFPSLEEAEAYVRTKPGSRVEEK